MARTLVANAAAITEMTEYCMFEGAEKLIVGLRFENVRWSGEM
jgi:hypothetical protein